MHFFVWRKKYAKINTESGVPKINKSIACLIGYKLIIRGAGEWTIFRKIALPQMRLGILIFGIIVSADLWSMVEEPLVYIQDITKYPLSVFFSETKENVSYAGAAIFSLPVVLLFINGIQIVLEREET